FIHRRRMDSRVAPAAAQKRDVVNALRELRHQVADPLPALAVLLELARARQEAGIALSELTRELAQTLRQRLATPLLEFRLRIKEVERRRPADHEHEDDRLGLRLEMRLLRSQW